MMVRVGRHVRVTGRVQGVFFRAWIVEQAKELGVAGWVRNCVDGSVEAHLASEESAVAKLIERLRIGPPQARVEKVEVKKVEPATGSGFEVRH